MKKLLSTDHFLLTRLRKLINSFNKISLVLLGPAIFFSLLNTSYANSPLTIAIIDTGFCPTKTKFKNVTIESSIDLTNSVSLNCSDKKLTIHHPRFHGQLVLEEFLKFYNNKKLVVHLYPLIVFNQLGDQKKEYWLKAIEWIKRNKIDVVITASGFITNEKIITELPALWFVSSGRVGPQIKMNTSLFPQNLAPLKNLFLIGDFYDGRQVLYDQGLLFQNKIDYCFPSGDKEFKGTSRAVAEASARALSICPIATMRVCLEKISKIYNDNLSKRIIRTF